MTRPLLNPWIVAGPTHLTAHVHAVETLDSSMRPGEILLPVIVMPEARSPELRGGGIVEYKPVPVGSEWHPAILGFVGMSMGASTTSGATASLDGWGLWVKPWGMAQAVPTTWPDLIIEAVAQSWEAIATNAENPHQETRYAHHREEWDERQVRQCGYLDEEALACLDTDERIRQKDAIESAELRAVLKETLPNYLREVMELWVQKYRADEIAVMRGLEINTVYSYVKEAKALLRSSR